MPSSNCKEGSQAQFLLEFRGINGVTSIVPQTVGDVSYQIHIFAFIASQKAVNSSYQNLDDVDVLPLVEASDIIGLGNFSSRWKIRSMARAWSSTKSQSRTFSPCHKRGVVYDDGYC